MKLTIIGAGSTYTPELIEGIINRRQSLDLSELVLHDIDADKLKTVGGLAQRMLAQAGMTCRAVLTVDLDEALRDASFVLTQIRVGRMGARILDEKIPLKYNLLGQETMGIGGFFKAQRTIPVILQIARRMEELCPDAFLINFTNPAGIVTQALLDHSGVKAIGLCNCAYNMEKSIAAKLSLTQPTYEYLGLNHLTFITAIRENGVDYMEKALREGINSETMKNIPAGDFEPELIRAIKAIPSPYLGYIYHKEAKLKLAMEAEQSRGEKCLVLEKELLALYADEHVTDKPKQLESRGGAYYSLVAISLVDALYNDKNETHVVNVKNNGALCFMHEDDVVETKAVVGRGGAVPLPLPRFDNRHVIAIMRQFKVYERLAVEAAVTGDRETAIQAFLANPLIGDFTKAYDCFLEMLEAHKPHLPQYFR